LTLTIEILKISKNKPLKHHANDEELPETGHECNYRSIIEEIIVVSEGKNTHTHHVKPLRSLQHLESKNIIFSL